MKPQARDNLEMIFDDGNACKVFSSLNELILFVNSDLKEGIPVTQKDFIEHEVHGEVKGGLTASYYKNMVLTDLELAGRTAKQVTAA